MASTSRWRCLFMVIAVTVTACGGGDDDGDVAGAESDRATYVAALERSGAFSPFDRAMSRCLAEGIVDTVGLDTISDAGLEADDFAELEDLRAGGIRTTRSQRTHLADVFGECIPVEFWFQMFTEMSGVELPDEVVDCIASEVDTRAFSATIAEEYAGTASSGFEEVLAEFQTAGLTCNRRLGPDLGPQGELTLRDGSDAFAEAPASTLATPVQPDLPVTIEADEASCVATAVVDVLGAELEAADTTVADTAAYLSGIDPSELGLDVSRAQAEELATGYLDCVDVEALTRSIMTTFFGPLIDDDTAECFVAAIDRDAWFTVQAAQFERGLPSDPAELAELNRPFIEAGARCGE
jgi:hypothetical protein